MATRGFEFVGMLDGVNAGPVIRDWPMAADWDGNIGDLVVVDSSGYGTAAAATNTEFLGVLMEDTGGTIATAGTEYKMAILMRNQIWRCSSDAATVSGKPGYTKANDIVDRNTIDADNVDHSSLILYDTSTLDDDGYVICQVVFGTTTFNT